ncbi:MAG TPA: MerR family transcriptional regulator [Candidatus Limnocylindrales bacterium]|nr:MerR family transcriptional regulator [Candidatus Limnocylindrales bacterium]
MYTIKQAAARSGVTVQLLRAWERRYGVVEPARTESGYRLYDDAAIDRLRLMRRLMDDGWSPSSAAKYVRELDDAAVRNQLEGMAPRATDSADVDGTDPAQLPQAFVASAAKLDERGFESVLDEMFARGSFEHVTTELVMPALVALGVEWAEGNLDVAAEHAAAGAVQRRLGMAFMAAGRAGEGRDLVLVGMPPGARHDLGALAFATSVRRAGIGVRYLGADLPLQDWIDAVVRTHPLAVAIGVVLEQDVDAADRVATAIRAANPELVIAFGGRAAESINISALAPAIRLPPDMMSAVDALRSAMGSKGRRARRR